LFDVYLSGNTYQALRTSDSLVVYAIHKVATVPIRHAYGRFHQLIDSILHAGGRPLFEVEGLPLKRIGSLFVETVEKRLKI
jgi:hypothetical protein